MIKGKWFGVFCLVSTLVAGMVGCAAESTDESRERDETVQESELQNVEAASEADKSGGDTETFGAEEGSDSAGAAAACTGLYRYNPSACTSCTTLATVAARFCASRGYRRAVGTCYRGGCRAPNFDYTNFRCCT